MMTGKRPSIKYLMENHDWLDIKDLCRETVTTGLRLNKTDRTRLKQVAAYYDWYYGDLWGEEYRQSQRRKYITLVLEKFVVLSLLVETTRTTLSSTSIELLDLGPGTETEYVDMYYRSSFLSEEDRIEMREEYERKQVEGTETDDERLIPVSIPGYRVGTE